MNIDFLLTSLIVVASPGTGVLYTVACGLSRGVRTGVVAAFGCTLGIIPHMLTAVLGLAAVFTTSPVVLPTVRKWVFRNLGGDFHARGLITRRLSSSNPARPYICRFSIFRRFTWPSTTPLLQLLVMASHIAAASVFIPAATR